MTTVHPGPTTTPQSNAGAVSPPLGPRQQRRAERRRLVREQLLAVAVLVVALAITVLLLGLQWLDSGTSAQSQSIPVTLLGGNT
jgi:type VI protein secretion system component VasF